MMKTYLVTFEREVIESATIYVEAEDRGDAMQKARNFVTDDDWERGEISDLETTVYERRKLKK